MFVVNRCMYLYVAHIFVSSLHRVSTSRSPVWSFAKCIKGPTTNTCTRPSLEAITFVCAFPPGTTASDRTSVNYFNSGVGANIPGKGPTPPSVASYLRGPRSSGIIIFRIRNVPTIAEGDFVVFNSCVVGTVSCRTSH